ncbi:multidrug resistance efflux transporter family protein [Planococcus sp. CP5-4]|uniref:DMT family transporter n=1 Tax=unclassified Planococcus (in: firmicutes) TaxID=2662419 RepID=UPI001C244C7D|nr:MULTISPECIES: multidrug resistance efflux transporter family protein [unclassified Planococcus (in: firmicutes)]MBU9673072.1 multidrug resistance efflux transporter family protein [Planococcus sp. CP5-4_YE]MBV0908844.1 multidrug resistance efflux transporter family protein [Planococcus sp. CP5-4_UN]MBW6063613.1 multidrug resistance efflux transporter family protein [Planococcus sp. CP5-4]
MKPIFLGLAGAMFFAVTFIVNALMEAQGGHWIWSASLRYIFMIPFLLLIVSLRGNLLPLFQEMKKDKVKWLLWSFIGFGLFYAPLCFAAAYSPGWLIAGTWQFTIIAGTLLAPLFFIKIHISGQTVIHRQRIPIKGLLFSIIILAGIALLQLDHLTNVTTSTLLLGLVPVLIAAFAYPLGNRKMMEICEGRLDAYQRVLGMTIASLPLWLVLSIYGFSTTGLPSTSQISQSLIVAISSGVVATVLFFMATDMVRINMSKLAAVEATQSMEVIFALIGEFFLLSIAFPSPIALLGLIMVILGMAIHSFASRNEEQLNTEKSVMHMNA